MCVFSQMPSPRQSAYLIDARFETKRVEDGCTGLSLEDFLLDILTQWDRKKVRNISRLNHRMLNP